MTSLDAQKKRQQSADNKVIAQAVIWLTRYDAETVASLVWNKYGWLADVIYNGSVLTIGGYIAEKRGYEIELPYMTAEEIRRAMDEEAAASAASEREAELRNESILAGEYSGTLPGDEAEDIADREYAAMLASIPAHDAMVDQRAADAIREGGDDWYLATWR